MDINTEDLDLANLAKIAVCFIVTMALLAYSSSSFSQKDDDVVTASSSSNTNTTNKTTGGKKKDDGDIPTHAGLHHHGQGQDIFSTLQSQRRQATHSRS